MNKKVVASWVSFAMMLSFVIIIIEVAPIVEGPTIIYVDDVLGDGGPGDPPENFTSIQDAINSSNEGDTVFVYNGIYYENVLVNKTINLIGENRDSTIIDGGGSGDVVNISADWVNVSGLMVRNGGSIVFPDYDAGIELCMADNCSIINNNAFSNGFDGISLWRSFNNHITNNRVLNCSNGIHITWSSYNDVTNNNISDGDYAIYLAYSSHLNIAYNDASNNDDDGIFIFESSNIIVTNNIFSSNKVAGIYLYQHSSNHTISGNKVLFCNHGMHIATSSNNNSITKNIISSNRYGLYFHWDSDKNRINTNTISLNKIDGIHLNFSSSENNITNNNFIYNNRSGIYLNSAPNNKIHHNNFIDNTIQAQDSRDDNYWDNGYPSGGNYWSDFNEPSEGAYDDYQGLNQNVTGSDGIVDNGTGAGGGKNPYVIDSDSQDNYPLMEPFYKYCVLEQGWNLISIPLIQDEQKLTTVLSSIDGFYDAVQWYNVTDTKDLWKHHKVGKPYGNDLSELNEKIGFWIHITQPGDTIFLYNGSLPTSNQTLSLHPGWNLVGYPSLTNYNRTKGLNNLSFYTHVDSILTYEAASQKWKDLGPFDFFEPGRGYWIHANQKCIWEVPL